jgi:ABC-type nitrate/sulfonate/bicarbonate transport system permease component
MSKKKKILLGVKIGVILAILAVLVHGMSSSARARSLGYGIGKTAQWISGHLVIAIIIAIIAVGITYLFEKKMKE